MRSLVFFYDNQWQSGTLLRSSSKDPQYYWFFFDTPVLPGDVDQYLCFVQQENHLEPTKTYAEQYQPLVQSIQHQVENLLQREHFRNRS